MAIAVLARITKPGRRWISNRHPQLVLALAQERRRDPCPVFARGVDAGQTEQRRAFQESGQDGIEVRVEGVIASAKGDRDRRQRFRVVPLLDCQQAEMGGEVRDIDRRLRYRRVVEIEDTQVIAVDQDLIVIEIAMDRPPAPAPRPVASELDQP